MHSIRVLLPRYEALDVSGTQRRRRRVVWNETPNFQGCVWVDTREDSLVESYRALKGRGRWMDCSFFHQSIKVFACLPIFHFPHNQGISWYRVTARFGSFFFFLVFLYLHLRSSWQGFFLGGFSIWIEGFGMDRFHLQQRYYYAQLLIIFWRYVRIYRYPKERMSQRLGRIKGVQLDGLISLLFFFPSSIYGCKRFLMFWYRVDSSACFGVVGKQSE